MSTSDILTLLLALYGAIISTVLALREIKKDKRRVKVICKMALSSSPRGDLLEFVAITAINVGHRPVEITMAGLLMSNNDVFTQARSSAGPLLIPKKLEDGESVSILFDFPQVEKAFRERSQANVTFKKAFVNDAEGNVYTSPLPRVMKDRKLSR